MQKTIRCVRRKAEKAHADHLHHVYSIVPFSHQEKKQVRIPAMITHLARLPKARMPTTQAPCEQSQSGPTLNAYGTELRRDIILQRLVFGFSSNEVLELGRWSVDGLVFDAVGFVLHRRSHVFAEECQYT